ncbi:MAG: hypothetical protein JO355_00700 [Planctomycetaceae bacterium]|nr:hypothetical protein [Planctomycetaceae bacterium]
MSSHDRRAAARCRAWGRGPIILRFEPLEGRQLLTEAQPMADLVSSAFDTLHNLDWGDSFHAVGQIRNQGDAPVTVPFKVEVVASTKPVIGPGAVPLGEVTIPAGLQPGQSVPYDQVFTLPQTPIPGYSGSGSGTIYIETWIDPEGIVPDSNPNNLYGLGQGYDTSVVTITPHQPSQLIGASLGVYPDQTTWGQAISVTAQITNNAQGDAPATRARLVLTPAGATPGGPSDLTIGYLQVPAIPAWQTVNVSQPITLPPGPPPMLAGATQFTLSMIEDADYVANALYPHQATQGLGHDMVNLAIGPGANADLPQGPTPDLAVGDVQAPSVPVSWGQDIQVQADVQNLGQADAGQFQVQFVLTGASGSLDHAIYLGDATVPGLQKGMQQTIVQTIHIPGQLPSGLTLDSLGVGRIAAIVDPDHVVGETNLTNNVAGSNPVTLRVLGTDGTSTVPTAPAPAIIPMTQGTPTPKPAASTPAPNVRLGAKGKPLPLRHHPLPPHRDLTGRIEHKLKIFPGSVTHFVKDFLKKA